MEIWTKKQYMVVTGHIVDSNRNLQKRVKFFAMSDDHILGLLLLMP